ncbi:uncharacterized protein LOC115253780 [Aedes albopictus]|uniref:Asteroid domain-containing protein n=1 Tax=Aedes albopictus TaxID=7160 RepID=A0ABM2A275_AEDAL
MDLMCLVRPFIRVDKPGLICGGRFNEMSRHMDTFFSELVNLGVKLHFFCDGPVRMMSPEAWCKRADDRYWDMIELMDAIDNGDDMETLSSAYKLPFHYVSTVEQSAMRHGEYHWATARECDQEMAAFANETGALAIMTDDSDMLIYEGSWRFWCVQELSVTKFTMMEYDRVALRAHLGLDAAQMPLLATLVGNDLVDSKALGNFHHRIGRHSNGHRGTNNISNVARFIREHADLTDERILIEALEFCVNRRVLMERFRESLGCYRMNYRAFNERYQHDPIESILLSRKVSLFYQMWHVSNIGCPTNMIDLREELLGQAVLRLKLSLIIRMGGVILYQRQMQRRMVDYSECHIMTKLQHTAEYTVHHYSVEFPDRVQPPSLEELLSNDPVSQQDLLHVKHNLLSWIVSDRLDHSRLEAVPPSLQTTVLTLYCLVERRILKLFEADLLLRVAYDVAFDRYEPETIPYPRTVASRPFRVAFVFQAVYSLIAEAYILVGLSNDLLKAPPLFDGVLFHNRYADWQNGLDPLLMDGIEQLRIYSSIAEREEA